MRVTTQPAAPRTGGTIANAIPTSPIHVPADSCLRTVATSVMIVRRRRQSRAAAVTGRTADRRRRESLEAQIFQAFCDHRVRPERRRRRACCAPNAATSPPTGATYLWSAASTAMVNQYYFYAVDDEFLSSAPTSPYNVPGGVSGRDVGGAAVRARNEGADRRTGKRSRRV